MVNKENHPQMALFRVSIKLLIYPEVYNVRQVHDFLYGFGHGVPELFCAALLRMAWREKIRW